MKKPTLKQVRIYFKDAKEVCSLYGTKFILQDLSSITYSDENDGIYYGYGQFQIWYPTKGYAEILTYKETKMKIYTITKEQILKLDAKSTKDGLSYNNLRNWFPDAFKSELEVGKWYKSTIVDALFFLKEKTKNGFNTYGFSFDNWATDEITTRLDALVLATEQEVKDALFKEAEKRKLFGDIAIKNPYSGDTNHLKNDGKYVYFNNSDGVYLTYCGWRIFFNGKWATILPTETEVTLTQLTDFYKEKKGIDNLKVV